MKICIVGAGAIGGLLGARLAALDVLQVCALARGATLAALQRDGWRVAGPGGEVQAPARASDDAHALGVQDLVIVAVKAHALPALAPTLRPLLAAHTMVMPAMNGVPWWFCEGLPGPAGGGLRSVDPEGAVAQALPRQRVLGCVVHLAASTPAPGQVWHAMGRGLIVGEAVGGESIRAAAVVSLLQMAGFEATLSSGIRQDIWFKLWGNLTMNPVSALTGATLDQVLADPLVRALCNGAMSEAQAIGARIGCPIEQSPEDRHAVTARLGAFKTSMLQDVQAGRPIELDAIVGAVHEIGSRLAVPMPHIGALLGLTRLMARTQGLLPKEHHV